MPCNTISASSATATVRCCCRKYNKQPEIDLYFARCTKIIGVLAKYPGLNFRKFCFFQHLLHTHNRSHSPFFGNVTRISYNSRKHNKPSFFSLFYSCAWKNPCAFTTIRISSHARQKIPTILPIACFPAQRLLRRHDSAQSRQAVQLRGIQCGRHAIRKSLQAP